MENTTYNIYFSRNGHPDVEGIKVAELGVPPQGCFWGGNYIQGPDWPEMVWSEDGNGYAYRADLDEEPTEEENTEWDRIMEEARYNDLSDDAEALSSAGFGTEEDYGYYG
jgi:hypothetical protein